MMDSPHTIVLMVDDDDVRSARRLATMLREDGYEVDLAADEASAIARLSRPPIPSALVTDLRMPSAHGTALFEFARSKRKTMPIFVITIYPQLAAAHHNDFDPRPVVFTKPVIYADLSAALATACRTLAAV